MCYTTIQLHPGIGIIHVCMVPGMACNYNGACMPAGYIIMCRYYYYMLNSRQPAEDKSELVKNDG